MTKALNLPQHSTTLTGDYSMIADGCVTTNNQAPDSRSSFSISTVHAKINNATTIQVSQLEQNPSPKNMQNAEPYRESKSFIISKFKENISNSDVSQYNQGSGRPRINFSMGIGPNKLINNSSQIEEEEEKTPTLSSQQDDVQAPNESP